MSTPSTESKAKGLLLGILAFFIWGLFPIYWKQLKGTPAPILLCYRICWSVMFLGAYIVATKRIGAFRDFLRSPKILMLLFISALLISSNWLLYVWAVNTNHIIETSMGYFINPLVSIVLAVVVLKERLRKLQWCAVSLAAVGIAWMTYRNGSLPWISIGLALTFGFYGLIRKKIRVDSILGLSFETFLMFPLAMFYLFAVVPSDAHLFDVSSPSFFWIMGAGLITILPLIFFADAARVLNLSTLGLMQYIAPTLQFLTGVFIYGEAMDQDKAIAFVFIWTAVILYFCEGELYRRKQLSLAKDSTKKLSSLEC